LYRYITQDHKLPLLLLLNKCDLVPAAAAAAWQQWLQQQLPGVGVVLVSAAAEQSAAAARSVLDAVMRLQVERGGRQVKVGDFVGMSTGESRMTHLAVGSWLRPVPCFQPIF
jgi:ribosome biogenesis GTPase A